MDLIRVDSYQDGRQSLFIDEDPTLDTDSPDCAYLHKPIIAMVMGSLMSAVGALLFLFKSSGVTESSHSVASACLSIGLMFVVLGLVWIPVLKEKHRRKACTLGE